MIDKRENIRDETLAELKLKLAHAHLFYYKNLLKYGPNLFEDDGSIFLRSKDGSKRNRYEGRTLITDTLKYFEAATSRISTGCVPSLRGSWTIMMIDLK